MLKWVRKESFQSCVTSLLVIVFMLSLHVLEVMRSRHPDVIIMWDMMLTMDWLRLSSLLNYDVGRGYFYSTAPLGLVHCSPTALTAHVRNKYRWLLHVFFLINVLKEIRVRSDFKEDTSDWDVWVIGCDPCPHFSVASIHSSCCFHLSSEFRRWWHDFSWLPHWLRCYVTSRFPILLQVLKQKTFRYQNLKPLKAAEIASSTSQSIYSFSWHVFGWSE